jgi:glycosyltransferase involved in cell wall biosynthesis
MINVYCKDKGWLFEDLKQLIASYGAVASEKPLKDADAWICIRSRELVLSPNTRKTVCQVHDLNTGDLNCGHVSLVHPEQYKKSYVNYTVDPIGSRDVPLGDLPVIPTIGFFCREQMGLKRSEMFKKAVNIARESVEFAVLMIGDNLEGISDIGVYEKRPAVVEDYKRIDALVTCSVSSMIPLSVYEAISCGRAIVTTPRNFIEDYDGIFTGKDEFEIAEHIVSVVRDRKKYDPFTPFSRNDWARKQVEYARGLICK